jgi:DNA-binding transcriptional regulator YiaG
VSNHPNRSRRRTDDPARTPTPEQVREARDAVGLSQRQAAELVHSTTKAWERWESGERPCHPAIFELFAMKSHALSVARTHIPDRCPCIAADGVRCILWAGHGGGHET